MTPGPPDAPAYPDLTTRSAAGVDDLLPAARADLAPSLQASRSRPLPPAPYSGAEPAGAVLVLARRAPHPAVTAVPEPAGAAFAAPDVDRPLPELGVAGLLAAFAAGLTTPSAVVDALSRRWGSDGPAPGAVVAHVSGVAAALAESDRRWRQGAPRPLEGIPVGVKDIIDVADTPVTCGSLTTGDRRAAGDAVVVARLRAAGAVPVVMTATTEFACGAPHNARFGAVGNPWDPSRWTGGSSTGSAAALAGRLVPLALGTDTGGSIRVPSALCGLTGIKPTYGLVPRTGVASLSWTLDHVGPMARDARDLALVLVHVAGPDGADPSAGPAGAARALRSDLHALLGNWPDGTRPLAGLRLGLARAWFTDLCDAAVVAAWEQAAGVLGRLGAQVVDVAVPGAAAMHEDLATVLTCELASQQEANLSRFAAFDIGTQVRIARGLVPGAVDYLRALRSRGPAQERVLAAWDDAGVDVVLTPGVGGTAPRLADVTLEVDGVRHPMQGLISRNTGLVDYLGFPALMMPAAVAQGLPVGVQVIGRPWGEATCLRVAAAFQAATDHHRQVPSVLTSAR